jgi:hypothetical protein
MGNKTQGKNAGKRVLTLATIEDLRRKGYNQTQIAEMYGRTRQAVSWHRATYGGTPTVRQIVNEQWPWDTNTDHSKNKAYHHLRNHGEFMVTGGKGMSVDKRARLIAWWARLRDENVVLEFDPSLPPLAGVAPHGGFRYTTRLPSDGDLLIRVNDYTTLTEEGRRIWCWPPDDYFVHEI